jgi:hypothetical protein
VTDRPKPRPGAGPGVLRPPLDPQKVAELGSQVARATADLEAMRVLAVVPEFSHTFDGSQYTVKLLGAEVTDPFLSRAILLAAQASGALPKPDGGTKP